MHCMRYFDHTFNMFLIYTSKFSCRGCTKLTPPDTLAVWITSIVLKPSAQLTLSVHICSSLPLHVRLAST